MGALSNISQRNSSETGKEMSLEKNRTELLEVEHP